MLSIQILQTQYWMTHIVQCPLLMEIRIISRYEIASLYTVELQWLEH